MCETPAIGCTDTFRMPIGVEPPRDHAHGVEEAAWTAGHTIGEEAVDHAGEAVARSSGSRLGAVAGPMLGTAVWGLHIYDMTADILTAESQGRVRGLLDAAYDQGLEGPALHRIASREARAAGVGAVLSGFSEREIERMSEEYPGADFRRGVDAARQLEVDHPSDFDEARNAYRIVQAQWQEGAASAQVGWQPSAGAGPVFEQGRESAARQIRLAPDATTRADQIESRRRHAEGFEDGFQGRPDATRIEREPAYRLGVRRAIEAFESGTQKAELDQIRMDQMVDHGRQTARIAG